MKKSAILVSCLVVGLGLGAIGIASAGSSRPGDTPRPARDRDACFDPNFIRGFQTPGGNKVIIISGRNEAYELTLGGVCIGLDSSFVIGVRSRYGMNDVCGPFDADILYDGMGGRTEQCPVTGVRHLTVDEAAEYIQTPKKKKDTESNASGSKW